MAAGSRPAAKIPFVDLVAQHASLQPQLSEAISAVVDRADFILGPAVDRFESEFARFIGAGHCVGVSSGLDALRLGLMALEIGPGDEVVVPANTFIATALAVTAVGAKPVLVDCDARTYNMDPDAVPEVLTPRAKVLMPVHLAGRPCAMDKLLDLARRRNVVLFEDACQAHGAKYKGTSCGALGKVAAFSFYPGKNLGAMGDGGAVTTDDAGLATLMRRLRTYGQERKYVHLEKGLNARLDTIQAAALSLKLARLAEWNEARSRHAQAYLERLTGVGDLQFQAQSNDAPSVWHLFMIETAKRDALQKHLDAAGVSTGIHYPTPIHLQAAYKDLGHKKGDFPNAERLAERTLSLPMYAELTDELIDRVCDAVRSFF